MADSVHDRIRNLWVRTISAARYERLAGSLRVAESEIDRRIAEATGPAAWQQAARDLLGATREALARGRLDQGWKLLHAARRMEVFALERDAAALETRATVLRTEAGKLPSWRQKAVERVLGSAEKPLPVTAAGVYEASVARDDHYDNQGYKDEVLRTQMLTLSVALVAALALVAWVLKAGPDGGATAAPPRLNASVVGTLRTGPAVVPGVGAPAGANVSVVGAVRTGAPGGSGGGVSPVTAVIVFGFLGSTLSAMVRAIDTGQSSRIPQLTAAMRVTFLRIVMGGASALAIYVLMSSGLGSAVGAQLFSAEIAGALRDLQPYTMYTIALVAGSSERLVTRAVEKIAGADDDKPRAGG